jgi:hypothetical protein
MLAIVCCKKNNDQPLKANTMSIIKSENFFGKTRTQIGRLRRNWLASSLVSKGRQLARAGNQSAALTAFKQAFDLNPSVPLAVYESLGESAEGSSGYMQQADALMKAGSEAEANEKYKLAIAYSGNYRETRELDRLLQQVVDGNFVVITQLAINYFPMFELWYRYFRECDGRNLLVIALDPVVYRKIKDMGVPVYLLPVFNFQAGIRNILWYETVRFRKRLIDMGVDYLHSDIDAFWLENPVGKVRELKADIVASIGYGTPQYVVDDWGFVMCLGFYMMRSTEHTRKLYPSYLKYTRSWGHDQNGLNTLLWQQETTWQPAQNGLTEGRCERLGLNLAVLPDTMISRQESVYSGEAKPLVVHPLLEGKYMSDKLQQLAKAGIL